MRFKRQTNRTTKMDETTNINLLLEGFQFAVVESGYWGTFKETKQDKEIIKEHKKHSEENPLIEIDLDGKAYELTLEELKEKLRKVLK